MGMARQPAANGVAICRRFGKDCLTKGTAKKLAKSMERKTGSPVNAYVCRACGKWHVGMRRRFAA